MFMYIHIYFIIEQNFKTEWKQTNQPCVVPHVYVCMIKSMFMHVHMCLDTLCVYPHMETG